MSGKRALEQLVTIIFTFTDRDSPPPTYDIDGLNITFREGDIIDRGGDILGEAAAVGVPWKNGRIPYVIDCSISKFVKPTTLTF